MPVSPFTPRGSKECNGREKMQRSSRLPGAYLQALAPLLYVTDLELHNHGTLLLHLCGRGCNVHIALCAHHQTGSRAD